MSAHAQELLAFVRKHGGWQSNQKFVDELNELGDRIPAIDRYQFCKRTRLAGRYLFAHKDEATAMRLCEQAVNGATQ